MASFWGKLLGAVPVVGSALADILGASKSSKQASKAQSLQERQWQAALDWRKKYMEPQAQWGLEQTELGKPGFRALSGYFTKLAQGDTTGLPSYLQPAETTGAGWDKLVKSMSTISDIGMEKTATAEAGRRAALMASRGQPISQEQATNLPGFQRYYRQLADEQNAEKALQVENLRRSRTTEAQSGFYKMGEYLRGGTVNSAAVGEAGAGLGLQVAGQAGQVATAAGKETQDYLGDIADILAYIQAQRDWKKQNWQAPVIGEYSPAPASYGAR
jgi:hypothetical protein